MWRITSIHDSPSIRCQSATCRKRSASSNVAGVVIITNQKSEQPLLVGEVLEIQVIVEVEAPLLSHLRLSLCISLSLCIEQCVGRFFPEHSYQRLTSFNASVAIRNPDVTQHTPRVTVAKEFLEVAQWLSKNGIDDEIRERSQTIIARLWNERHLFTRQKSTSF